MQPQAKILNTYNTPLSYDIEDKERSQNWIRPITPGNIYRKLKHILKTVWNCFLRRISI